VKKKFERWWLTVAALLLGGFAALNILAYRHAHAMMHFAASKPRTGEPETLSVAQKLGVLFCGVNLPRPRTSLSTTSLGVACRSIMVDCANPTLRIGGGDLA
jgi:hypothetical protein